MFGRLGREQRARRGTRATRRSRARAAVTALAGAQACASLLACNAIEWRGEQLARRYERAGLQVSTRAVGDGDEVRVWTGGEGPALVFIHGFGAHADWQWIEQAEAFAPEHQLVIPDLLYFGGSRCAHGDHTLTHQVETLRALLADLEIARADLVGVSYGGFVAYGLATQATEATEAGEASPARRIVLVDSPGPAFTRADHDAMLRRFDVASAREVFVPEDEEDIQRLLEIAYTRPPRLTRGLKRQTLETLYKEHAVDHAAVLAALMGELDREPSARPPVPPGSLLIWGRDDPVFPVAIARRLEQAADVELVVLDDARHAPNLERPDAFNDALRRFLAAP